MLKSLATVSGLTLLSRVLGFARQILVAGIIGAGGNPVADAFWAAFRLPNMFRRLFAEGAFHAAFIPMFQRHLTKHRDDAKQFAEDVMIWLIVLLSALTAIVEIAAPFFVTLLAGGFRADPDKFELTTLYTRIMFPYLACMAIVGLFSGILNSLQRFIASAGAPIILNICMIGVLYLSSHATKEEAGLALSLAVMAGGFLQLAVLMIGLARQGFLLKLRAPSFSPEIARLLQLGAPGFISAGALQINLIVGTNIASREPGAVSWLMNADALYQLPLAVIGIALGSVLLPGLSRQVKAGDEQAAHQSLNRALEVATLLCLPASVAFLMMGTEICDALYRGVAADALSVVGIAGSAFTEEDAARTGIALALFGVGLPAFVWQKVLSPAFFAREDTRRPMRYALISIAINIVLALSLFPTLGYLAIPLATSLAAWIQVLLLAFRLKRDHHFQPDQRLWARLFGTVLSAVLLSGFLWLLIPYTDTMASILLERRWIAVVAIAVSGFLFYGFATLITGALRITDFKSKSAL